MPEDSQSMPKNTTLRERPLLFGLAVQKERPDGGIKVRIRWSRLFAVFLILLVICWVSAAGALYAFLKYEQGFKAVELKDTLLFQKKELKRKMGDQQIQESIAQLEAGNNNDAFRLLHFGVARSPGNLEGRKLIAYFYEAGKKRPAKAAEYMLGGLEQGGIQDIEYVKELLGMLLRNQMVEKVQAIADIWLPEEPELTDINRVLALGAANANYQQGNYDRAEDYIINYNLFESIEGLLIFSKISWERGNRIAAVTKLETMLNRFSDPDKLLLQLSIYYREMSKPDKARRFAMLRSLKDPLNYKPQLELLYIYNQEGDTERETSETERIFKQFSDNNDALLNFAGFAAKTGNVDLAKRIRTAAQENGFEIGRFNILLIEAYVVAEDYTNALDFSEELIEKQPDWLSDYWTIFNGLRSVAAFAIGRPDLGEIYLQNFLEDTQQNPQPYQILANHFVTIDRIPQARKILATAYRQIPTNQKILSELIELELELGNTEELNELLTRLLKMRRPEMELLAKAYRKLGSDRFIFAENRDILLLRLGAILRENNTSLLPSETTLRP